MPSVFKKKAPKEICSFLKFGSYSTKKGQFNTTFRTFRDISPEAMRGAMEDIIARLRESKNTHNGGESGNTE